jgi:hypothetical protein
MGHIRFLGGWGVGGENIENIRKRTGTSVAASKDVGLEVNVEKTKWILVARYWNAGQNRDLKIGNKSFENVIPIFRNDSNKSKFDYEEMRG